MRETLKPGEMNDNIQFISVPTTKDPQPQKLQKTGEQQLPLLNLHSPEEAFCLHLTDNQLHY